MDKYNPEQFEILDCCEPCIELNILRKREGFTEYVSRQKMYKNRLCQKTYHRILIRRKQQSVEMQEYSMQGIIQMLISFCLLRV